MKQSINHQHKKKILNWISEDMNKLIYPGQTDQEQKE